MKLLNILLVIILFPLLTYADTDSMEGQPLPTEVVGMGCDDGTDTGRLQCDPIYGTPVDIKRQAAPTSLPAITLEGASVSDGGTDATVRYAAINVDGADSDSIVAAVADKKLKVLGYTIVCDAATTITFEDGDGTDFTGAMAIAANGGVSAAVSQFGQFETTTANKSLNVLKGSAANCDGHITYAEVD